MSASENVKNQQIVQVVAMALRNAKNGKYLLAKRKSGSSGAGEWEFPGGKVELGESEASALVREIKEELNFDLGSLKLEFIASKVHHYSAKNINIILWMAETHFEPQFELVDHDEVAWFGLDEMNDVNLSAGDKYFISLLK